MLSSDEGDHDAGANVGRAIQPTPANCDGATVSGTTVTPDVLCTYPAGTFGELAGNMTGLLATEQGNTTPFTLEADTAPEFYVTGNPGPNDPAVRTLERDVGDLTAANPYTGTTQPITNYLADPTEEAILHMVNADPARTPDVRDVRQARLLPARQARRTATARACSQSTGFACDHGDYAAEIDTNYSGFAGPGVRNLGVDGPPPTPGRTRPARTAARSTVPGSHTHRAWTRRDRHPADDDVPDRAAATTTSTTAG